MIEIKLIDEKINLNHISYSDYKFDSVYLRAEGIAFRNIRKYS